MTITDKATKAISHLDSSRAARLAGDIGSAESALDAARAILLELAGSRVTDVRSLTDAQLSAILETVHLEVDRRVRDDELSVNAMDYMELPVPESP
jgi:hypothetical protein